MVCLYGTFGQCRIAVVNGHYCGVDYPFNLFYYANWHVHGSPTHMMIKAMHAQHWCTLVSYISWANAYLQLGGMHCTQGEVSHCHIVTQRDKLVTGDVLCMHLV